MAGLIRRDFNSTVRRFPILGSLPVIGALFRSTGFQREDTELVIIVTPRLVRPVRPDQVRVPTDYVRPSSEADLFLRGRTERAAPRRAAPFEALPPAEPPMQSEPANQEQPLPTHLLEEPRS
jgi:pilus assembly protein CpaC